MSRDMIEATANLARESAVEICWLQWSALGSLATPVEQRRASAIVDPEALVILSHFSSGRERRLVDLLGWWAESGAELVSVQRFRTLAGTFPSDVGDAALRTFAALASEAGDRRWKRYRKDTEVPRTRPDKGPEKPGFVEPATLWVRLRAGLGVGTRADVLTYLLGLRGSMARAKTISTALGYSTTAVRTTASEMARARLIREVSGHPTEYVAPPRPWVELLELYPPDSAHDPARIPEPPPWRPWAGLFSLLAGVVKWSEQARASEDLEDRVLASRARDLLEEHRSVIAQSGIQLPATAQNRGADFLVGFRDTLERVTDWMREAV